MSFDVGDIVLNGGTEYLVTKVMGDRISISMISTSHHMGTFPSELFSLKIPAKPKEPYEDIINKIRHIKQKRLSMGYTT